MTMTFVDAGNGKWSPKPEKPRCYVVAMYVNGKSWKHFKAIYPDNWDDMEPYARYHYTRGQAIAYYRDGDLIDEQLLKNIVDASMSIYSGDWVYHLDDGIEGVHITAAQMEDIFVDSWEHRDLT